MVRRLTIVALGGVALLSADSLTLRSGNTIQGTFVGGDSRTIRFASGNQITSYNVADVTGIRFSSGEHGDASATSTYPPQAYPPSYGPNASVQPGYPAGQTGYPSGPQPPNSYPTSQPAPGYGTPVPPPSAPSPYSSLPYGSAPAANPAGVEIPAGTPVVVRLIDPVNSETDRLGQTYRASIDEPVMINGQVIVPRGADVVVSLVGAQQSGKIEGRTSMTLALRNLMVNGTAYNVTSSSVTQASDSRGSRSAKVVGGTAALGAIIGGLAGGGRGAAIGAVSGGAVGAAAEVATSGQKVKVPAETRLTFTLQNPVDL